MFTYLVWKLVSTEWFEVLHSFDQVSLWCLDDKILCITMYVYILYTYIYTQYNSYYSWYE